MVVEIDIKVDNSITTIETIIKIIFLNIRRLDSVQIKKYIE